MKTCKDCYHFEACVDKLGTTKFYDNVIAANNVEDLCKTFKDKSLVLDLPCKVGDTVYQVMDIESVHRQILEIKILSIEITDTVIFFAKTIKKYRYNYGKFSIDDFGKTVFLTREAAEQALKEREQG